LDKEKEMKRRYNRDREGKTVTRSENGKKEER
jgi:hypothetical protein